MQTYFLFFPVKLFWGTVSCYAVQPNLELSILLSLVPSYLLELQCLVLTLCVIIFLISVLAAVSSVLVLSVFLLFYLGGFLLFF